MELTLIPKTRAGRNKLANLQLASRDWNGRWVVDRKQDAVNFAPGKRGPWLLVEPTFGVRGQRACWVHATDDENFTVQPNA